VPSSAADREIVTTRVIDAPRELVFEAFTDREHVGNWYGPNGFRITTKEMDVRPGGSWRFTMHGPDGTDYPNRIDYIEVARPERIVCWHGDDGGDFPRFHQTFTFTEESGRTRVTMRALWETVEACRMVKEQYGAVEGGQQTLARLDAHLAAMQGAEEDRTIVSTRVFDAPRELVFKAWSEAERIRRWWGPKGFTNTFHEFDFRAGGQWRFIMHGPDGNEYPNHSVFVEIVRPERIVFDHISGHRFRVTATFAEEGARTRVSFRMTFETVAECEKSRPYVAPGNEQNFDKLAAELATMA